MMCWRRLHDWQLAGVWPDRRDRSGRAHRHFRLWLRAVRVLTGKRAFEGKTRASLIGAIMHAEPLPVSQVQPVAPAALNHIVAACLAKDADDRWQSARDLMCELKWVAEGVVSLDSAARTQSSAVPESTWSRALTWTGAAAALVFAIAWLAVWSRARLSRPRAQRP
jgi:hypothetical protein